MSLMSLFELSSAESSDFKSTRELGSPLWPHQVAALEYVAKARRVLIGDEVGVGKTAVAIAAIDLLSAWPALVVPPAYLRYKWKRDFESWLPGAFVRTVEPGEPLIIPGQPEDPDVFIISYNLMPQHAPTLVTKPLRAFVADEGHFLKNAKAKRTKACLKAAKGVPLRLILGATPIEKGPRELLAQLDILDQTVSLFGSGWKFLQHFCNAYGENVEVPYGFAKWDFSGARNLEELNRKLRSTCYIRREKTQVHKSLPPLTSARIDIDITNRVEYFKAENDFVGWLQESAPELLPSAVKAESLVKVGHLKRLCALGKRAGAVEWIDGFLEENPGQKLVVFTFFRSTAEYFSERYNAPLIIGGVPVAVREEFIEEFQTGRTRVIIISIEAGGVGIELFAASNCVFLELDWVPTTHTQASGRLHRPGQTSPVTAWYLVGRETIEERIFDLLVERERVIGAATQGGRAIQDTAGVLESLIGGLVTNRV